MLAPGLVKLVAYEDGKTLIPLKSLAELPGVKGSTVVAPGLVKLVAYEDGKTLTPSLLT